MGIAIIATTIGSSITSGQVQELKRQINALVNQHKDISEKAQQISKDLQKLDLKEISQKLNLMNQNLSQNLKTIIQDQQTKLQMISQIDTKRVGQDPKTLLAKIFDVLNIISTVFLVIEIMCATNPATIAISGILLVLNSILTIFSLINNIKAIQQLSEKKAELEQYFKSGGKFEQDIKSIATLSYQVVENFYLFVVNFKSMINQLAININLLSLSRNSQKLNYQHYLDLLRSNPFTEDFEKVCLQTYRNFISIQNYDIDQKVNMSCKYLEDFQLQNDVIAKIQMAGKIASNFTKDSDIGKQLERASSEVKKLTTLKGRFLNKFQKRKEKSRADLPAFDKDLLEDLVDEARKIEEKQLSVVEVVSFFTTEFFADDSTGRTLFKMDLRQIYAKTEFLGYLGVASNGQNLIYLPQPQDQSLRNQWQANKSCLQNLYRASNPNKHKIFVKKMYIRMQCAKIQLNNENKSRLNYYYGIQIMDMDDFDTYTFQKGIDYITALRAPKFMSMQVKIPKIEKVEETDEDLQSLCNFLCFYINGIAYPERIVSLKITKEGNKYKGVVEWNHDTVKPEFFGKTIKFSVEESDGQKQISETKEKILQSEIIKEDKKEVVFRTK